MSNKQLLPPFEAYKGQEPYIFISYSHKDSIFVFPEIKRLSDLGYRIWYDEGIDPGNEWPEEIAKALNLSSFFVVFISSNAVNSKNVKNEINFALNKSKPFLAIHLQDIPLPVGLELRMGDIQAILKYRMEDFMYERKIDKVLPINLRVLSVVGSIQEENKITESSFNPPKTTSLNSDFQEEKIVTEEYHSEKLIITDEDYDKLIKKLDQEIDFKPSNRFISGKYSNVLYIDGNDREVFSNDKSIWNNLLYVTSENDSGKNIPRNFDFIVLKAIYPLGNGPIFQELTSVFQNRLIIITSLAEIRKERVLISKGLSWEQTSLDLIYELRNHQVINRLLHCKVLIITLESEGAIYLQIDQDNEIIKCRLLFDPEYIECEWWDRLIKENEDKEKLVSTSDVDLVSCFSSIIVKRLDASIGSFNYESSISEALSKMRISKIMSHFGLYKYEELKSHPFLFKKIVEESSIEFASALVPIPEKGGKSLDFRLQDWTILEGNYRHLSNLPPLFDLAFRVALRGFKELVNTPFLRINSFITYDRREIEELRGIKNLINGYLKEISQREPLSLGFFANQGTTGGGYLVKQIAQLFELPFLEYNLSQFMDFDELEKAFEQIIDWTSHGQIPIVVWNDFDSHHYRWIPYLLPAVQSKILKTGKPIRIEGKCLFVFSSNTSSSFEKFVVTEPNKPNPNDDSALHEYKLNQLRYEQFIQQKGPDFKDSLSGFVNVKGINQHEFLDTNGNVCFDFNDKYFPIRRAIAIRTICGQLAYQALQIDFSLLNALVKIRRYIGDTRSLENILKHIISKNRNRLQMSNLPSLNMLKMWVSEDFSYLLDKEIEFELASFDIARQLHQNWKAIGDRQGWKLEYHKDYDFLPPHIKDEYIAGIRRIPNVLSVLRSKGINLLIVPNNKATFYSDSNFEELIRNKEFLELMASEEHKGWVKTKINTGWAFNRYRNDDKKLHNCIIGWDEEIKFEDGSVYTLSEREKAKDLDTIAHYPEVLNAAGFVIVKDSY